MHILFFNENYYSGGMDTFIINLLNNWPNKKDKLTFVVNRTHPGVSYIKANLKVPCDIVLHNFLTEVKIAEKLSKFYFFKNKYMQIIIKITCKYILFLFYIIFLNKYLKKFNYDKLFIINGGYPAGSTCCAAALLGLGKQEHSRPIMNFHNDPAPALKPLWLIENLIDFLVKKSISKFVTVSYATRKKLKNRPFLINPEECHVIYNGLEELEVIPEIKFNIRENLNLENDTLVILMLATYEPRKGHRFLFEAAKNVSSQFSKFHIVCFGFGYQYEINELKKVIDRLDFTDKISLLNFQNDVTGLYAQADLLVMPSQRYESFGLSIVEAMRAGVPVLATKVGGIPEVLENENGGILADLDVNDFSKKLLLLLSSKSLRVQKSQQGREQFVSRFNASSMAQKYYSLVNNIETSH